MCNGDIPDGSAKCGLCGTPIIPQVSNPFSDQHQPYASPQQPSAPTSNMEDDLGIRMLIPVGRSVHSIIAGYLGLLSLGCCALGPFAIIFGVLAVLDIRKNPKKGGIVRAILGIVLGTLSSLGLVVFLIGWIGGEFAN